MSELLDRQIARLTAYCVPNYSLNLNVPTKWFNQRDNYTMPHRTCNSSANCCQLNWWQRVTGRPGIDSDDQYLRKVLSYGDTIYHHNQTKALKDYGFGSAWIESKATQADRNIIGELITNGIPVTVNILHRGRMEAPRGGHVITLCGWLSDSKEWLCQDPYGTLRSDYQDTNGRLSRISAQQFAARWQGGYRVLA